MCECVCERERERLSMRECDFLPVQPVAYCAALRESGVETDRQREHLATGVY